MFIVKCLFGAAFGFYTSYLGFGIRSKEFWILFISAFLAYSNVLA